MDAIKSTLPQEDIENIVGVEDGGKGNTKDSGTYQKMMGAIKKTRHTHGLDFFFKNPFFNNFDSHLLEIQEIKSLQELMLF
jgi:hypothetical protein